MLTKRKVPSINVDSTKCCGCLICPMRCSLRFEKAFDPSSAAIQIRKLVNQDTEFSITFTDKCDSCGICARFCPSGALTLEKKEVS